MLPPPGGRQTSPGPPRTGNCSVAEGSAAVPSDEEGPPEKPPEYRPDDRPGTLLPLRETALPEAPHMSGGVSRRRQGEPLPLPASSPLLQE